MRALGVTLSQVNTLLFIDRFPDATMPRLADAAAVTPQAMHRTVIGLEGRGLVERERKAHNEKSFFLSLSPQGKQILNQAEIRLKKAQVTVKERLNPQEIETLQTLLEKYESIFKEVGYDK